MYSASWCVHLYLSSVKGCVLCLYTLGLGGQREDHLRLQAEGQLLVVLLLCTVTWSLVLFVLCKQIRFSLHQELSKWKQEEYLALKMGHTLYAGAKSLKHHKDKKEYQLFCVGGEEKATQLWEKC